MCLLRYSEEMAVGILVQANTLAKVWKGSWHKQPEGPGLLPSKWWEFGEFLFSGPQRYLGFLELRLSLQNSWGGLSNSIGDCIFKLILMNSSALEDEETCILNIGNDEVYSSTFALYLSYYWFFKASFIIFVFNISNLSLSAISSLSSN